MNEFENFPAGFSGHDHEDATCESCGDEVNTQTAVFDCEALIFFCDVSCEEDYALAHNLAVAR
jgi:hypothetical protein